ncbi:unnamed protein product [Cuscuta campestris]|uniref:Uncharacterized protein n=1 Tax=Cuscuta campestris TaxID=132261 RepID=A0A484NGF3_9ASTE|nr:unnamed protein product [Cuscuta campestris]
MSSDWRRYNRRRRCTRWRRMAAVQRATAALDSGEGEAAAALQLGGVAIDGGNERRRRRLAHGGAAPVGDDGGEAGEGDGGSNWTATIGWGRRLAAATLACATPGSDDWLRRGRKKKKEKKEEEEERRKKKKEEGERTNEKKDKDCVAEELSEFLHLEIGSKYEDEVLEFYKNGKVTTVQSKKNPQRTISVIKSTVGGTKVKISQKKLKKKLHVPNSGIEIGKLPSKNLDWKTFGISGQIPSAPAKKADLKNDYKLISKPTEPEIPEKSTENLEKSPFPETTEEEAHEEQAVEVQRSFEEAEEGAQIARLEASEPLVAISEQQVEDEVRDSLFREISNYGNEETDSSATTLPDEILETWIRKVQGLIESALKSQHASFRQEMEQMETRHNQMMEKSEEKYCSNLNEISKSVDKTLAIISLLSKSVSNTMMAFASDCHLQFKEATAIRQQIATITVNLQKWMSLLQMDIGSALAVSSANQVVTQDYLKVLADNQKEAFRLFRHFGTYTGKQKLEVIVQPRSPSQIPKFPIEVKQGELSYIPSHLNMTELILEAQQSNPENSIQHLSNTEFDGTEDVGTIASHFTNDAQTEERYNNLKRIQEECGVMQGIGEVAGSSKHKKK